MMVAVPSNLVNSLAGTLSPAALGSLSILSSLAFTGIGPSASVSRIPRAENDRLQLTSGAATGFPGITGPKPNDSGGGVDSIRRASEFSITLEKLSLSTLTSAALVVTLALRMFRATSPNGTSPSDCAHAPAASSKITNWIRQVYTGSLSAQSLSYFASKLQPITRTQVQVIHLS